MSSASPNLISSSDSGTTATPLAPEAIRITVSLVESCPSTEMRSNERFTQTPSSRSAVPGVSAASVWTKHSMVANAGEIIPAPLLWADRRTVPEGSSTSSEAFLANRSVVRIESPKAASPSGASSRRAFAMPRITLSVSSGTPITPVDATATCSSCTPAAIAPAPCMRAASSSPRRPVAALALPAFATTARSPPRRQRSWVSRTGAASTPERVKRAALTVSGESETSRPRSSPPDGLSPHATPAARKPAGRPPGSSETCSGSSIQREFTPAPSLSSRPNIRLRFWIACDDVPFQRLSIVAKTMMRPVRSSSCTEMRQ